ncbi:hypothetical protein BGX27_003508 [Mortierella sp. AM989]|nr:hypothetical protein BGX27_003508 [Mortierella sp. AM989]
MLTIGKASFTPSFQAAIRCYVNMSPEFLGIIVFVHTHVDYMDLHPTQKVLSYLTARKKKLHDTIGVREDILERLDGKQRLLEPMRSEERNNKEYIKEHDTSDFAMIHQTAFDDLWKDNQINNYRLEFPKQKHKISKLVMLNENVRICKESGGEGEYYLEIEFEPLGLGYCMLHAKVYTVRSVYYHD